MRSACQRCEGRGYTEDDCKACNGFGYIYDPDEVPCDDCDGTGKPECSDCMGSGLEREDYGDSEHR